MMCWVLAEIWGITFDVALEEGKETKRAKGLRQEQTVLHGLLGLGLSAELPQAELQTHDAP